MKNIESNESGAKAEDAEKEQGKSTVKEESAPTAFQQIREICESLAVALFLAFLFKTFEAEAFVIPTGSMAPTLKGRHKDVVCDECGFRFQTSASEEMDSATNRRSGMHVVAGVCPQCGFSQYFGDETPNPKRDKRAPSYTGDRILVSKLTFDERELRRWDVSVFRSPAEPKINFIKRIVGLPNERLRVQYGDLFVQKTEPGEDEPSEARESGVSTFGGSTWAPDVDLSDAGTDADGATSTAVSGLDANRTNGANGGVGNAGSENAAPFEIARKDWRYLRQMLQLVCDADYPAPRLEKLGWPDRWTDDAASRNEGVAGWTRFEPKKNRRGYRFDGAPVAVAVSPSAPIGLGTEADVSPVAPDDAELSWLRYRNVVPSSLDWVYLAADRLPPDVETSGVVANNPRLIDDFSAYNAGVSRLAEPKPGTGEYAWADSPSDDFAALAETVVDSDESGRPVDGSERVVVAKNPDGFGCNWVGDLAVSCDLTIEKTAAETDKIAFDLVKGGVVFRCSIAPKLGTLTIEIPSVPQFAPQTLNFEFKTGKKYAVEFLNVDEEMRVVVDGKELTFPNGGGRYDALTAVDAATGIAPLPRDRDPNARDLAPVAVGARGATVRIERLKIWRDVYYIAAGRKLERWDSARYYDLGTARCDRLTKTRNVFASEDDFARFMSTPSAWAGYGATKSALLRQRDGQYVAFGDNSGFSLDSRLWANGTTPHYVDRKYLIGKAFYVYWPHGREIPGVGPFWPNVEKMRRVD